MPVYTVHAPSVDETDVRGTTDRFVFVRDGFSFWAFVFGPVWLLYRRLWLAFAGYLVLSIMVEVVLTLLRAGAGTRFAVMAVIAVLIGLEAASLQRWTLSRRKWLAPSMSLSPTTKRRPSDVFSIAGRRSGVRTSICRPSIAAGRHRLVTFRASRSRGCRVATLSACFRNPGFRGERCDHRLRLRQPALRRQGVRVRGAWHGGSGEDRRDARSRRGVPGRSRGAAWRRRVCRLPHGSQCARWHGRGPDGGRTQQGAPLFGHLRRHAIDGDTGQGARHDGRKSTGLPATSKKFRRAARA